MAEQVLAGVIPYCSIIAQVKEVAKAITLFTLIPAILLTKAQKHPPSLGISSPSQYSKL